MSNANLEPFKPTKAKVNDVFDALKAAAQLPDNIDAPVWLSDEMQLSPYEIISCKNGLLHLPTLDLIPHTPAFFSLNSLDFDYDPDTRDPEEWLDFLDSVWPEDEETIDTLQEMFGYLLTQDTSQQKIFALVGPKRSGKGTIGKVLTALLGPNNVVGPTLDSFSRNFGLTPLIGKQLATISDARLGARSNINAITERLLSISGEDALTIDRKFRDPLTRQLNTRILLLSNEIPKFKDASGALVSRFIILRMTRSFYNKEDTGLADRLLKELPGILNWAIEGWQRLNEYGCFEQPSSSAELFAEFEDLSSPIHAFIRDCCEVKPSAKIECDKLFRKWGKWCDEQGRDFHGIKSSFGRDLRAAIPTLSVSQPRRGRKRIRVYSGIRLKTDI